jgi:hypothetical protein
MVMAPDAVVVTMAWGTLRYVVLYRYSSVIGAVRN